MSRIPTDFTMRHARTGMMIQADPLEHILNTCQRIFHKAPDRDIYSKENGLGLDIMARSQAAYNKGIRERDHDYERKIQEQFNLYTDIVITNVMVTFIDKTLTVRLAGKWHSTEFEFATSSDPNLADEIRPKVIPGM